MSGKKRTTVSLEPGIIDKAQAMMADEHFGDFSGFLEQVIRERWAKRPTALKDAPKPSSPAPAKPSLPVSYRKTRARGRRHN